MSRPNSSSGMLCWSARRSTSGVKRRRPPVSPAPSAPSPPVGEPKAGSAATASLTFRSSGHSSSLVALASAIVSTGPAASPAAWFVTGSGSSTAATSPAPVGATDAEVSAASPSVAMIAICAPMWTVVPSSAVISLSVPAKGDGISALTLSVVTSTSGSYFSTVSPGCLSQRPIVPSVTLSPSCGIATVAIVPPSRVVG